MINGLFCDHDSAQPYAPDLSDQDSQYAPTPGYYNDTILAFCVQSFPGLLPPGRSRSLNLRPARNTKTSSSR